MFDVVIMGSGMVGTILGSILSRHGVRVLIVDSSKHPRFAIGEATLRETTMMLKLMAAQFDVPEIAHPSSYLSVKENIGDGSGMKRSIGYVYHREGEAQRADEVFQTVIPETFDGPEIHYFRAEVDEYLAEVAVKYGATLLDETKVTDLDFGEESVQVKTNGGDTYEAKYIVDATGFRSVLADKYDLRDQPSRFRSNSRSLFTHMTGVKGYEDCGPLENHQVPHRWSQGTLHQCFDGGWIWVIPLNNGPDSSHDLVSIGLQLDNRKYPNTGMDPEEEFRSIIAKFPSINEQFENAENVRPWISTGDRLQYSSKKAIGHRYCLTAHAYGQTGPLMSRGLILSTRTMYPLAQILIKAVEENDFSEERFSIIQEIYEGSLEQTDALCEGFYESWKDWDLFNAWLKVWYTTGVLGFFHMEAAYSLYKRTQDSEAVWKLLFGKNSGSIVSAVDAFQPYMASVTSIMREVIDGGIDVNEGARQIREVGRGYSLGQL